jgi:hypothetical protein
VNKHLPPYEARQIIANAAYFASQGNSDFFNKYLEELRNSQLSERNFKRNIMLRASGESTLVTVDKLFTKYEIATRYTRMSTRKTSS